MEETINKEARKAFSASATVTGGLRRPWTDPVSRVVPWPRCAGVMAASGPADGHRGEHEPNVAPLPIL